MLHRNLRLTFLLFFSSLSTACTSGAISQADSLKLAYDTPGIVSVQPYTRTIFSSHNF